MNERNKCRRTSDKTSSPKKTENESLNLEGSRIGISCIVLTKKLTLSSERYQESWEIDLRGNNWRVVQKAVANE